jgi:hypothetical protein
LKRILCVFVNWGATKDTSLVKMPAQKYEHVHSEVRKDRMAAGC